MKQVKCKMCLKLVRNPKSLNRRRRKRMKIMRLQKVGMMMTTITISDRLINTRNAKM